MREIDIQYLYAPYLFWSFKALFCFQAQLNSRRSYKNSFQQKSIKAFDLSLAYFFHSKDNNFINSLNIFLACYALILTLIFSKKLVSTLAHAGFIVILLGVMISSSGAVVKEINLKTNEKFTLADYTLTFSDLEYKAGHNFIARVGVFEIDRNNKHITTLKPELRLYPISNQTTNESAIYHHPFYDLYIVIGTKDEQDNYAIRSYLKPLISLIWIGVAMIIFAIATNLTKFIFKKN